jgi:starch phosphorylase
MILDGLSDLGFRIEDVINQEHDAALGNGGLGRLAACFMDSMATLNYPAWGYGLRYRYGIFKQEIVNGYQVEIPDYWLDNNPWEFPRHEITVDIQFYGNVKKYQDENGRILNSWEDGEIVQAIAYDVPIPGYGTKTTNNLRLWSSKASSGEFDFQKFNAGDYESAVVDQQRAETISAVLYPNDNLERGKELRLKQQYFWCAASLFDIVRRFKKTKRAWAEFPDQVAIQLNDTHPTLAIVELQRILIDMEGLEWDEAWSIVTKTFGYTNHTVLPEALEKWSVPLMQNLLPRHLQIIYEVNLFFLQSVEKRFPNDRDILSRVSIIEESHPKMVRMAYLAIIGSHKVNGVAELHSDLLKSTLFKDFVKIYGPDRFTNVTNGITPRRWLHQANPRLSALIAEKLGGYDFLKDLTLLDKIEVFVDNKAFREEWAVIKRENKLRLARHIKATTGYDVNPNALFDVQVKRIHEYKRQQLNIFGVIHRYLSIKAMSAEEKKKVVPRVSIFGGKAAPGYWMAKTIIHLINNVADVVNKDPEVGDLLKVIFIADYNVSKAEIICPASDISEHISTAGTEGSGTSNMKFVLNGGLIIGTCDGANVSLFFSYMTCFHPTHTNSTDRSKSHAKSASRTSSSSAISLKTSRTCATDTSTGASSWTHSWSVSSTQSKTTCSATKPTSPRSQAPSKSTVTTISSRTISTPTSPRTRWSTRPSRIRRSGWPSRLPLSRAWDSSLWTALLMSTLIVSGMSSLWMLRTKQTAV